MAAKAKEQAQRFAAVHALIQKGKDAANGQQFELAQRVLSEAGELGRGVPSLVSSISAALVEVGSKALGTDWRAAKTFLEKAAQIDSGVSIPAALWRQIELREREENVRNVLEAAESEQNAGRPNEARERLENALHAYPNEQGIISDRKSGVE